MPVYQSVYITTLTCGHELLVETEKDEVTDTNVWYGEELRHPEVAWSRAATLWRRKEPNEAVRASDQDVSGMFQAPPIWMQAPR